MLIIIIYENNTSFLIHGYYLITVYLGPRDGIDIIIYKSQFTRLVHNSLVNTPKTVPKIFNRQRCIILYKISGSIKNIHCMEE